VNPVAERRDPVMEAFLAFLATDIAKQPEAVRPMSRELAARIDDLVAGVTVSENEPLGDDRLI
jgi:antitoxin PrlF